MMKRFSAFALTGLLLLSVCGSALAVNVRSGEHERSNRLVFDWNKQVDYKINRNGNTVTLQFSAQDKAQLAGVIRAKLPYVRNIMQKETPQGLQVSFQVPDDARMESFRLGNKTAFDIVRLKKTPPVFSAAQAPSAAAAEPAAGQKDIAEKAAKEKPVTEKPAANKEEKPAQQPETPDPADLPATKVQTPAAAQVIPPPTQPPEVGPAKPAHLQTLADRLAGINVPEKTQAATAKKATPILKGTRISIDPGDFTKLALFERAGKLWIVLDKPLPQFMPKIEGEALQTLTSNARRIDQKEATAFVFQAPENATYATRREKSAWQIWINSADHKYLPDEMPVLTTQEKGQQPQLNVYVGEDPTVVQIRDSGTGDKLWVVPVRNPEGRIVQPRRGLVYQFLPTMMGAAIILKDDNLQVGTENDMVVLAAKPGQEMLISDEKDRAKGLEEARFNPLFNLKVDGLKEKGFTAQRQELQKNLVLEKNPAKDAPILMDIARLYLSEGFGHEAIGILRMAQAISPNVVNMREFGALQGMAAALAGDLDLAEADLKSDELQSQPAAKLWLGYALARNNQWQNAKAAFFESGMADEAFPSVLRPRLVLARAETALQTGDIVNASRELKKIPDIKKLRPSEKAAYDYIEATANMAAGHADSAMPVYEELARSNDQLYRVKAELEMVSRKLASKEITLDKAIDRLERLRYSWRGDRLEIDILQRLGQYYVDKKDYMDGLTIWRQAASLSKNTDDTDAITQNMQDTFKKLYVEGQADDMQPLQAVALFERFRELTPPGEDGLMALDHLANRLASVDLLDEADALISKQLRVLAPSEDTARVGSKLASWRLQNNDAQGALQALDQTAQEQNIPEKLSQRRLLLRARALADLNQVDEALALLSTAHTEESYSLKADIGWRQNRWADAVAAMQSLLVIAREKDQMTPDGPMPNLLLKMAVAMTLDNNQKGVELLTAQYGDFMAGTKKAQAFALITKPSRGSSLADLGTLKGQVGEVELFQKFLQDFGK